MVVLKLNIKSIYENIEIVKIVNEIDGYITNFTNDTRKIKNDGCYLGIKGENNDGNLFYMEAFKNGAKVVILDYYEENKSDLKYLEENNKSIIVVQDTTKALGDLARYKRSIFKKKKKKIV